MADETLRIRVDVETATLRDLSAALKSVKTEMQDASQSAIPGLRNEAAALSGRINELTGRHVGFAQTIRESRQEARLFRFALTELIAGFDGMANSLAFFTGMSDRSSSALKNWTGAAKEGLGAGLGVKFALDAIGVSAAGSIGIAVGAITLLGAGLGKTAEEALKSQQNIAKLEEEIHKLRKELGEETRESDISFLEKQLADAMNRRSTFLAQRHVDWLQSAVKFRAVMSDETEKVLQLDKDVETARKALSDSFKADEKEDEKAAKEKAKEFKQANDEIIKKLEERVKHEQSLRDILDPQGIKMEKEILTLYIGIADALAHGNMELVEREAHMGIIARLQADNKKFLTETKGVSVGHFKGATEEIEGQSFNDIMGGWMHGIDVLNTGFSALSSTIHDGIVNAFGQANSVFQQFVVGVLEGIASIAEKLASSAIIAGIGSLFGLGPFGALFKGISGFATGGTLYEPVVGMGASGRMYSFAENSPERFSPLTSFGGGAGSQNIHLTGSTEIRNDHLMIAWKAARVNDRYAGGNV